MIFKRLALCCVILHLVGCAYTKNHQLPSVLTTKEWRGIIPKGQMFKAMQSAQEGIKDFVFPDQDMVVISLGELQEKEEALNTKVIKKSRINKKQALWGGGIVSLLGIIATVFWNTRKKVKIEGSLKGEA